MSDGAAAGEKAVFNPRTVAAVAVAGVVAFVLFMLLSAYSGDLNPRADARAHPLSNAATGFRGFVRLIDLGGGRSRMIRTPEETFTEELVVLTVEPQTDPRALRDLLQRRSQFPTIVILPKWDVTRHPARPGWVRRMGGLPPQIVNELLAEMGGGTVQVEAPKADVVGIDFLGSYRAPAPQQLQTISGGQLVPLASAGGGAAIAQIGRAPHYVIADPDLLNNHGLAERERARAALLLIDIANSTGAEAVGFDLTLNGLGSAPNALKLAFEPPFLPLTLALFVATMLAALHGAVRFGAPREEAPALAFGTSALIENSAALFRIARREHRAGGSYAELIREAAARDSGAHLALGDAELDSYLDRVSPPGGPKFSILAANAREASRTDIVQRARALFQWKKDLLR